MATDSTDLQQKLIDQYGPALEVVLRQRTGQARTSDVIAVVRQAMRGASSDTDWVRALQEALPAATATDQTPPPTTMTGRKVTAFLNGLPDELDREVLTRYFQRRESRLRICHELKLSEYRFDQIVEQGLAAFAAADAGLA